MSGPNYHHDDTEEQRDFQNKIEWQRNSVKCMCAIYLMGRPSDNKDLKLSIQAIKDFAASLNAAIGSLNSN